MYKKYSIALCLILAPSLIFSMSSSSSSSSSDYSKKPWTPSTPPPAQAACTLYATPKDDIIATIVADINAVEPHGYVGIESPSLTNASVIQSLGQALQNGVNVRIFTDTQNATVLRENLNGKAKTPEQLKIFGRNDLHAKRIVIAKKIPVTKDDEAIVYLGSLNMSNNGPQNYEIMMRCTDRPIFVESYGDQQRELISRDVTPTPVQLGTRKIMLSKSPEARDAKNKLIATFSNCKHPHDYLYMAMYTIDDQEIVQSLINAQKNKLMPIKIILDGANWREPKTALKQLVDAGLELYIFNKDGVRKTKYLDTRTREPINQLMHVKVILRNCNQECLACISTANATTQGITQINYDLWEPCSLTFSYKLKEILDNIIDQSEKIEPYMLEVYQPTNPDQDGKLLLAELTKYRIVKSTNKDKIMKIIAGGANVNLQETEYGETPLMKAAIIGDHDMLRALIDAGANINQRNKTQRTALMLAIVNGQTPMVQDLLLAHPELNIGDEYGNTALFLAIGQNVQLIKILLDAGADPNIPGDYRTTGSGRFTHTGGTPPLIQAIQQGRANIQLVPMLLEKGARPKDKDRYGKDAFDAAAGKPQILEMLNQAMQQRK